MTMDILAGSMMKPQAMGSLESEYLSYLHFGMVRRPIRL